MSDLKQLILALTRSMAFQTIYFGGKQPIVAPIEDFRSSRSEQRDSPVELTQVTNVPVSSLSIRILRGWHINRLSSNVVSQLDHHICSPIGKRNERFNES